MALDAGIKNVALIPARGGSKGIPGKNLRPLGGKPLIAWTIAAALAANGVDRVIVSTDDPAIARAAEEHGALVPFLRPTAIAGDGSPMIDVLRHAVQWMQESGWAPTALTLLQPTSPLRRAQHIAEAWQLFSSHPEAQSLVSVIPVPHQFHPSSLLALHDGQLSRAFPEAGQATRRQDKPVLYARNGPAILIARPANLLAGELYTQPCLAYLMDEADSIDIDTPRDFDLAEQRLTRI